MFLINLIFLLPTVGMILIFTTPIEAIWAMSAASEFNRKALEQASMRR